MFSENDNKCRDSYLDTIITRKIEGAKQALWT